MGTAFTAVHAARPALWHDLFHTDGFHPSPTGSYLEALVIYATIFGVLPLTAVSMPDDPAQLWARARVMQPAGTPPLRLPTMEEMRYLRIVAASVCAVPAFDQPAAASEKTKRVAAEKTLAKIQTVPVAASPPASVPQAAASGVDQQDTEDEPLTSGAAESELKAALGDQAKKDAEAQLRAAMPFWLQTADPAKLAPAIEAAKKAGVAGPTVATAEAKLTEALSKAAKAAEEKERKEAEGAAKAKTEAEAAAKAKVMAEARVKAEADEAKFAAKQANAALTAEAKVAARLKEMQDAENAEICARRDVETRLRAAMPFPMQTADPARLKPAIEAAKQAGVSSPVVAKAEAKLHEAEEKAEHAAMAALVKPKLSRGASIFDSDSLPAKGDDAEGSAAVSAAAAAKPLQTAEPLPKESSRVQAAAWLAAAEAEAVTPAQSPGCSTASSVKGGVAPTTTPIAKMEGQIRREAEKVAIAQASKTKKTELREQAEAAATVALEAVTAAAAAAGRTAARVMEGPAEARFSATEAKVQARAENMSVAEATEAKAKAEADLQAVLAVLAQAKAATEAKAIAEVELKAVLRADAKAMSRQMAWAQARRDAEAQLQAAMPFLLQKADPAKLGPAIEAAKRAGVAAQTVAMAELKLMQTLKKAARAAEEKELDEAERAARDKEEAEDDAREEAEEDLRAAMPFPFGTADPARLKPAIEAAKRAGVWPPIVESAEAKLHEAEQKAKRAPTPGSAEALLAKPQAFLTKPKMTRGASIFASDEGREEKMGEAERVQAKANAAEAKVAEANAEMPEHLLKFELRLHGAVETFPKQAFQARLCTFLKVDEKAVRKLQLSAGSVVVDAVVAMPDGEALAAEGKRLEDADLEQLSKELDQQARVPHPPFAPPLRGLFSPPLPATRPPTPGPLERHLSITSLPLRRSWIRRRC